MFSFSFESESVYAKQRRPNLDIANKARPLSFSPSPLLSAYPAVAVLHTIAHLYALWEGRGVLSKSPSCEKKGIVKPGMEGTDLGGNLKETQSIE